MSGCVLWFTGLPCCGKTTIANKIAEYLSNKHKIERLDGDVVRKSLCKDLGFSKEDRDKNLDRIIFMSKLLSRNGVIVINTFVSPYKEKRNFARNEIDDFIEIYVKCSVETCEKRDVKGMYKLAREGKIKNFTGIDDPYEEPDNPHILLDTENCSIEGCVWRVLDFLREKGIIE
jgi:adenylylsulfate kinase